LSNIFKAFRKRLQFIEVLLQPIKIILIFI
jgi:hypothetical protein